MYAPHDMAKVNNSEIETEMDIKKEDIKQSKVAKQGCHYILTLQNKVSMCAYLDMYLP